MKESPTTQAKKTFTSFPSIILKWKPMKVAKRGIIAMKYPFHRGRSFVFVVLNLQLLQQTAKTAIKTDIARKTIVTTNSPPIFMNKLLEKLYCKSGPRVLLSEPLEMLSLIAFMRSSFELKMLQKKVFRQCWSALKRPNITKLQQKIMKGSKVSRRFNKSPIIIRFRQIGNAI